MRSSVAAASRPVSWAPLALTLGLHLLLVLAWWWRPGMQLPAAAPAERETVLVMVRPPPGPAPAIVARPIPPPRPAPPVRQPAASAQATAPVTEPEPVPLPAEAESEAPPAPLPGELLAASRRMAGRIDRALRKDDSPITAEPERKWERFGGMVAAARSDPGNGVSLDSYTGLDGVTIYRKTVGERVSCYRGGSVGGLGPADGRSAGRVPCPTDVRWTRH